MYPKFLDEKLKKDLALRGAVDATVAEFEVWLDDSKLPFFPDYTDHGKKHLTQVLTTAVGLMTKRAKTLLTPADAAVLILATLLHDSAMHLSVAGFQSLIEGNAANYQIDGFDTTSWPQVWKSFLFSALRWDDRKLIAVFGEDPDSPGRPIAHARDPIPHLSNLTESDRKLIGEFIRQNHPRMAHEFAHYGVPGPAGQQPIRPASGFRDDLCDLAGLVARSHGMPMRSCLDYLETKYDRREYRGVHAVYLMAILRVADYLQIQDDRAPVLAFQYRHIPSKISQQEWRAHDAIASISQTHEDPEAIRIIARPEDVGTFLRLQEWLSGIQGEMDSSWAVLGEVYGSHPVLRDLGMNLRRVRSNLDDVEAFAKTAHFVPRRIFFGVATAELLHLMIRPLYGNRPEIGIRELLQNSLDAVRELWDLQERHPELKNVPLRPQEGDVEILLGEPQADGYATLVVSDRGVGMTEEIIRDYFLVAGATYRGSEMWRRQYENNLEGQQEPGLRSRVLRSGRFGIGVLAAFLLGDEIIVETRHVRALRGLRFRATLASESLELGYELNIPCGTAIYVRIPGTVHEYLRYKSYAVEALEDFDMAKEGQGIVDSCWDWYTLSRPKVLRRAGPGLDILAQKYQLPLPLNPLPSKWRRIQSDSYLDVQWQHNISRYFDPAPDLDCNGLIVITGGGGGLDLPDWPNWLDFPNLSVFDPDGNLPLNLLRDGLLTSGIAFQGELLRSVLSNHFASLLVHIQSTLIAGMLKLNSLHQSSAIHAATTAGVTLAKAALICRILPPSAVVVDLDILAESEVSVGDAVVLSTQQLPVRLYSYESISEKGMEVWLKYSNAAGLVDCLAMVGGFWLGRTIKGVLIVTTPETIELALADLKNIKDIMKEDAPPNLIDKWERDRRLEMIPGIKNLLRRADKKTGVIELGECGNSILRDQVVRFNSLSSSGKPHLVEMFWGEEIEHKEEDDDVSQFWMEVFGQPLIPLDPEKRRTQLARAYEILDPYIKLIEAESNQVKSKRKKKP